MRAHNPLNDEIIRIQGEGQRWLRGTDLAHYDDYTRSTALSSGGYAPAHEIAAIDTAWCGHQLGT